MRDRTAMEICNYWLGHQDSNLGMLGSKPSALPLGDAPVVGKSIKAAIIPTSNRFVNNFQSIFCKYFYSHMAEASSIRGG